MQVISLGLLYLNFKDAVREGDGDRVLNLEIFFAYLESYWSQKLRLCGMYSFITVPLTAPT